MTTTEIRSKVKAGNKKFMEAFARKDAAGVAKLYATGGQLLPPGSDFVKGREFIQAFWQGAMDVGIAQAQLETLEVERHRNTAIEIGKYTLLAADGQVADDGKYVVVWKLEGRSWKLHRDIWNSSQPCKTK
jgi:uncharacterized protein (TIGR02246 family)